MITASLSAENTFTAPIFVPPGERLVVEAIESVVALVATTSIQKITVDSIHDDPAPPDVADSRWSTTDTFVQYPLHQVSAIGNAWFRVGIETGNWTSGTMAVKLSTSRESV